VGVNVTVAVQLAPTASVAVQVVVSVKTVPVMVSGRVILRAAVPVLVMVTLRAFDAPVVTLPNAREVALRLTTGTTGVTPVPVRATVWGEPVALSAIDTDAERAPAADGLNVTLTVQEEPAASDEEHVLVVGKSAMLVPLTLSEVMVRAALPVFLTVRT
jgi:hypothetical protein